MGLFEKHLLHIPVVLPCGTSHATSGLLECHMYKQGMPSLHQHGCKQSSLSQGTAGQTSSVFVTVQDSHGCVNAGTSNQTRAYGQYYNSLPADGPEVMTLLYPDTAAGNAGLCRHLAFQQVMPNDTLFSNQSAGELAATATYTQDPKSHIFHSLGNITNPVLVMGGTFDIRISIADLYTLVDYIPDASLVLLDSAGHESVQQYAPSQLAASYLTFLMSNLCLNSWTIQRIGSVHSDLGRLSMLWHVCRQHTHVVMQIDVNATYTRSTG